MTDEQIPSGPPPEPAASSGIDLARVMLSQARSDARTRGRGVGGRRKSGNDETSSRRSGSGPDERDPVLVGPAVERLVSDRGWHLSRAVGGVAGRWTAIVGAELAAHCSPEGYDDGVLSVRADSTAWATQLRLLASTLLARLNNELGAGTVTSLNVVGPSAPSWKKGKLRVKGRGPRDTYG